MEKEGEGLDMGEGGGGEKTEGGFMIHLLAPDTRSILTEPRQSAHISLHLSLSVSFLLALYLDLSASFNSPLHLRLFPCAGAYDLPYIVPPKQTERLLTRHLMWVFEG